MQWDLYLLLYFNSTFSVSMDTVTSDMTSPTPTLFGVSLSKLHIIGTVIKLPVYTHVCVCLCMCGVASSSCKCIRHTQQY